MNKSKILNRAAKILAVVYILFISALALDVFEIDAPLGQKLMGLIMHLIPSFALIIAAFIAFRKRVAGGIIFILLAIVFTFYFRTYSNVFSLLSISAPLFIIGLLFLLSKEK